MISALDAVIEAAEQGFLPGDGGGHDVNATLKELPGLFTVFSEGLTALAAWSEELRPASCVAGTFTVMARHAATAAEAAQAASDRFRKENEFWLQAEGERSTQLALAEEARAGFIPGRDAGSPAYALADVLEAMPGLFDQTGEGLSLLAEWMRDNGMAWETSELVTGITLHTGVLAELAEEAAAIYQDKNSFWLSARGK